MTDPHPYSRLTPDLVLNALDARGLRCDGRLLALTSYESGLIPGDLVAAWTQAAALALEGVRHAFDRAGSVASIRVHGDCHASNVLWTPASGNASGGPHFVDFDDARMAPAIQDLWMLVSGDRPSMTRQLGCLLDGYQDFAAFDPRELNLVEALRTLRLLHYSAWLARRWDDPAFPIAFPWFNTSRYWQDRMLELSGQMSAMKGPTLAPLYWLQFPSPALQLPRTNRVSTVA